jgi:hypothetical protein
MLRDAKAFAGGKAKKRPARAKPKKGAEKPVMAATIGAAAAMLGCDLIDLQQAKKNGAPGFRANGSVNITEVREWLETHQASANEPMTEKALKLRKLLRQCEKLEEELAISRGKHTPNEIIKRDLFRIGAATRAAMTKLQTDVPNWEGLSAPAMQARMDERCDKICQELHDATSALYYAK